MILSRCMGREALQLVRRAPRLRVQSRNLIKVAGRQRTRLQEMSKEASLYSLFLSMGPYSSGRPSDEKAMNTELTCLKGFTPKSFNDLVQMQVHGGYPIGEKGIEAESL